MNMFAAIAHSAGNKAKAYNDRGATVIVQKCIGYDPHKYLVQPSGGIVVWYYVWLMRTSGSAEELSETTIENDLPGKILKENFQVDPYANYWQPV